MTQLQTAPNQPHYGLAAKLPNRLFTFADGFYYLDVVVVQAVPSCHAVATEFLTFKRKTPPIVAIRHYPDSGYKARELRVSSPCVLTVSD